jgi:GNAT superfamily N-acetyltransferase
MAQAAQELLIRRANPSEVDAAVRLAGRCLGWDPAQPNEALFRWKHLENPFGQSPLWVAESEGELVGLRTFLRWRFVRPDGSMSDVVRAVDTATHPDHRGQGIFRRLTLEAVEELRADGADFIFNTPNEQSRPGYLSMGWISVGRIGLRVELNSCRSLPRVLRAREPAEKWPHDDGSTEADARQVLSGGDLEALLDSLPARPGYSTALSARYLRWRYRFSPLQYRATTLGGSLADGCCVYRVRGRGAAREAAICELLVPDDDPRRADELLRDVRAHAGADYLIATSGTPSLPLRFVPLPRQGPLLVWRPLAQLSPPAAHRWSLALGDVELF